MKISWWVSDNQFTQHGGFRVYNVISSGTLGWQRTNWDLLCITLRPKRWQSFNLSRSHTWTSNSWQRILTCRREEERHLRQSNSAHSESQSATFQQDTCSHPHRRLITATCGCVSTVITASLHSANRGPTQSFIFTALTEHQHNLSQDS